MQYLVKLVRDKIGDNCLAQGVHFKHIDDDNLFIEKLREKLMEEATEYLLKPSLSEAGDILSVVLALVQHDLGIDDATFELFTAARMKEDKRGGFEDRIGLYIEEEESYT